MVTKCKFCNADVDTANPAGWCGRHRYGCRKVGRIHLEGFLEGYSCPWRCGRCGEPAVAMRHQGLNDIFYCAKCAEHPLAKTKKEISPFAVFITACYRK